MVNPAEIMPVLALALMICLIPFFSEGPPVSPKSAEDSADRLRARTGSDRV